MTTPEKKRLVELAVELDEQLKNQPKLASAPSTIKLAQDRVSDLSDDELSELSEASEVLAFLNQVRTDMSLLGDNTQSLRIPGDSIEASVIEHTESAPGETLGRFLIREVLGQGGFARVFRAFDPLLDRDVALKIPRPEALSSEEACARFIREGKAAAMLSHPAIVAIFEAGTFGPIHYIASAICSGETLCDWQIAQTKSIPVKDAASIVAKLADAIHHAHQRGIIHRDLKPSNIMIDTEYAESPEDSLVDRLRITDFGLAKQFENEKSLTLTIDGSVVGTPAYMSPEQVRCEPGIGPATDVYSLGVILHELLIGSPPHKRNSITATIRAIEADPVPPLRQSRAEIPDALDAICHKCLERNPDDRYESAFALAEDLNRYLNDQPILAKPAGPLKRLAKWAKRNPGIATSLLVTFTSLIAGVAASWTMYQRAETDRVAAVVAKEEKSDALDLAKNRMLEMNEQMDLLVGIFDKIESKKDGNFDSEMLRENLQKNLVAAAEDIFESDTDPSLKSRLASRLGLSLHSLGYDLESTEVATKALAIGRENTLPEHELMELELYVALTLSHDFDEIISILEPKLDQLIACERTAELQKLHGMKMLEYAYDNLQNSEKALTVQRRLVEFREQLREKYRKEPENEETRQQSAVRRYLRSPQSERDDVASRFHLAHNQFRLDRSDANLNTLLKTHQWIEGRLGRLDWTTIGTGYVIAIRLGEEHQTELAIKIGEAAYKDSVEAFGEGHYQTITAAHALLNICENNPDDEQCKDRLLEFAENAEAGCRKFLKVNKSNPQGIEILGIVASVYGQLGNFDKAIKTQRDNVAMAENHFGVDHQLTKSQKEILDQLVSQSVVSVPREKK